MALSTSRRMAEISLAIDRAYKPETRVQAEYSTVLLGEKREGRTRMEKQVKSLPFPLRCDVGASPSPSPSPSRGFFRLRFRFALFLFPPCPRLESESVCRRTPYLNQARARARALGLMHHLPFCPALRTAVGVMSASAQHITKVRGHTGRATGSSSFFGYPVPSSPRSLGHV
jgi:hypothetical protein